MDAIRVMHPCHQGTSLKHAVIHGLDHCELKPLLKPPTDNSICTKISKTLREIEQRLYYTIAKSTVAHFLLIAQETYLTNAQVF